MFQKQKRARSHGKLSFLNSWGSGIWNEVSVQMKRVEVIHLKCGLKILREMQSSGEGRCEREARSLRWQFWGVSNKFWQLEISSSSSSSSFSFSAMSSSSSSTSTSSTTWWRPPRPPPQAAAAAAAAAAARSPPRVAAAPRIPRGVAAQQPSPRAPIIMAKSSPSCSRGGPPRLRARPAPPKKGPAPSDSIDTLTRGRSSTQDVYFLAQGSKDVSLRAWSHCRRFFHYDRSRSQRTWSQNLAAPSHYIFCFSSKHNHCSFSPYLEAVCLPFSLTFCSSIDHSLPRPSCWSLSLPPSLCPPSPLSVLLSLSQSRAHSLPPLSFTRSLPSPLSRGRAIRGWLTLRVSLATAPSLSLSLALSTFNITWVQAWIDLTAETECLCRSASSQCRDPERVLPSFSPRTLRRSLNCKSSRL